MEIPCEVTMFDGKEFQKKAVEAFKQKELCDCEFIVGKEKRIKACKYLLAAMSDFFNRMLFGGMKESKMNEIKFDLDGCSISSFEALIKYCMTGECSPKKEDLLDLFKLADKCLLGSFRCLIKEEIEENVSEMFNKENFFALLEFCSIFKNFPRAKSHCTRIIKRNIEHFLNLKQESVSEKNFLFILRILSGNLSKKEEVKLFRFIVKRFEGKNKEKIVELTKKYIDFTNLEPLGFVEISETKLFSSDFLEKINELMGKKGDNIVKQTFLPDQCATLGTLETINTDCTFRLEALTNSKFYSTQESNGTKFNQYFHNSSYGGSTFDGNFVWTTYGDNDSISKKIYVAKIGNDETKSYSCYEIPFATRFQKPLFDGISKIYFFGYDNNGSVVCSFDTKTRNCNLKLSHCLDFSLKPYIIPIIKKRKIYHVECNRAICYYDIKNDLWKKTKAILGNNSDYISFCYHKENNKLWILDGNSIKLFDLQTETLKTIMNCSTSKIQGIPLTLKVQDYDVFCCYSHSSKKWMIIDPYTQKEHPLNWSCLNGYNFGHTFLDHKTKSIYFNSGNQWNYVKIK